MRANASANPASATSNATGDANDAMAEWFQEQDTLCISARTPERQRACTKRKALISQVESARGVPLAESRSAQAIRNRNPTRMI